MICYNVTCYNVTVIVFDKANNKGSNGSLPPFVFMYYALAGW